MYSTALDITDAANDIAAEVQPVDLVTVSPYITHTVLWFGNWTLNLTHPTTPPTPGWTWNHECCSPQPWHDPGTEPT
ncbi:hypothetical protein ACQP2T_51040 [Nonomuraea sp. CA-143628]|uniref:hypothetical protein n=1 Tax=Nonomuraea sp. CA-143628 TaxID=3239997 RepID=UPI003D8C4F2A